MPTKPKWTQPVDPPVVKAVPENPPSGMPDCVAVRLDGITYLLAPGAVKGFLARNTHEDHQEPDGLDKTTSAL
jgi:hypothetical protein